MNEYEIAKHLVEVYNAFKEQSKDFVSVSENINRKTYKNCDFILLEKFLKKMNFNMEIETVDGIKAITLSEIN